MNEQMKHPEHHTEERTPNTHKGQSSKETKKAPASADEQAVKALKKQTQPIPAKEIDSSLTADSAPEHGTDPSQLSNL